MRHPAGPRSESALEAAGPRHAVPYGSPRVAHVARTPRRRMRRGTSVHADHLGRETRRWADVKQHPVNRSSLADLGTSGCPTSVNTLASPMPSTVYSNLGFSPFEDELFRGIGPNSAGYPQVTYAADAEDEAGLYQAAQPKDFAAQLFHDRPGAGIPISGYENMAVPQASSSALNSPSGFSVEPSPQYSTGEARDCEPAYLGMRPLSNDQFQFLGSWGGALGEDSQIHHSTVSNTSVLNRYTAASVFDTPAEIAPTTQIQVADRLRGAVDFSPSSQPHFARLARVKDRTFSGGNQAVQQWSSRQTGVNASPLGNIPGENDGDQPSGRPRGRRGGKLADGKAESVRKRRDERSVCIKCRYNKCTVWSPLPHAKKKKRKGRLP